MTDRGLRLVLQIYLPQARLVPALPRLKSACPLPFGTGHTCPSTRAFASGFLQADIAEPPS